MFRKSVASRSALRNHRLSWWLGGVTVTLMACSSELPSSANGPKESAAEQEPKAKRSQAELVDSGDPKNAYLRAVAGMGNCSGVFIKTSENPAAPAYLLTANRCFAKLLDPGTSYVDVFLNQDARPTWKPSFDFLGAPGTAPLFFDYVRTAYATFRGVDLALIEIATTIGKLQEYGIEPLPLADSAPAAGAAIELVGVPHYGDGSTPRAAYRARCSEGPRRTAVVEQDGYWHDMHANDCAELGEDTTGSPALDQNGRVFGILTTHSSSAQPKQPCYANYPCEVGGDQPARSVDGANYVVDVSAFASCFDATGHFDAKASGCTLDSKSETQTDGKRWRIVPPTYGEPPLPSTWRTTFSSNTDTHYRYKVGLAASVDCRSLAGYSEPIAITEPTFARLALPAEEGLYIACILTGAGDLSDATWQPQHPLVFVKKVLGPTTVDPELGEVTIEQAFALGQQVMDAYRDIATANRARLLLGYGMVAVPNMEVSADRVWTAQLGLQFLYPGTSADVTTLTMCHEVGHALGGFPFKKEGSPTNQQASGLTRGEFGTVIATEGQSDYFAAKECLPRIWAGQPAVNAKFRATASDYVKVRCNAAWDTIEAQNICYRTAAAAAGLGRWLQSNKPGTPPSSVETPDLSLARETKSFAGSAQCRVDTVFNGARCRTKFRGTSIPGLIEPFEQILSNPAVETAAALDSCTEGPGVRPRCWFAPAGTEQPGFDCTGIPDTGMCTEQDGASVARYCDSDNGITTYVCDHSTCALDATGYAVCP